MWDEGRSCCPTSPGASCRWEKVPIAGHCTSSLGIRCLARCRLPTPVLRLYSQPRAVRSDIFTCFLFVCLFNSGVHLSLFSKLGYFCDILHNYFTFHLPEFGQQPLSLKKAVSCDISGYSPTGGGPTVNGHLRKALQRQR